MEGGTLMHSGENLETKSRRKVGRNLVQRGHSSWGAAVGAGDGRGRGAARVSRPVCLQRVQLWVLSVSTFSRAPQLGPGS